MTNSAVCTTTSRFSRYHFTGKERDTESGNDYFEARYYSSNMGRFMSPDWSAKEEPVPYAQLDDPQSLNLYSYVRNNPLTRVDADGHCLEDLCIFETIAVYAVVHAAIATTAAYIASPAYQENSRQLANSVSKLGDKISNAFHSSTNDSAKPPPPEKAGQEPGPTVDPNTGEEVGRFVVDPNGNTMIEPKGGETKPAGKGNVDTHTTYPNGSNYQRLNPKGHQNNPKPHGHGHLPGTGPGKAGQGPSIGTDGTEVKPNTDAAHWPINH